VPLDPNSLPHDPEILKQMLVDLTQQLDKTQRLLRQLMAAKSGTRSEQLSADQLRLFAQELGADFPTTAEADAPEDSDDPPSAAGSSGRESLDATVYQENRVRHFLRVAAKPGVR
jgi:hypothetical protein